MTKKIIDESVSLSFSNTLPDGTITNSTISAEDLVELVAMMKNAGIQSADYNGPASLFDDGADTGISTSVGSPSLRSIMQLLEPVFQSLGDAEAEVMDQPEVALDNPEMPNDTMSSDDGCVDAVVDNEGNLALVDDDIEEDADYDYRSHDVHTSEYPGPGGKTIVQPKTKMVPARSGDDPIEEADDTLENDSKLVDAATQAKEASKAGFVQHVNSTGNGSYTLSDWYDDNTVVSYSNGRCISGNDPLENEPNTDMDNGDSGDLDMDLEFTPEKGFKDYFNEAMSNKVVSEKQAPKITTLESLWQEFKNDSSKKSN